MERGLDPMLSRSHLENSQSPQINVKYLRPVYIERGKNAAIDAAAIRGRAARLLIGVGRDRCNFTRGPTGSRRSDLAAAPRSREDGRELASCGLRFEALFQE
jgi:hypothetical protein